MSMFRHLHELKLAITRYKSTRTAYANYASTANRLHLLFAERTLYVATRRAVSFVNKDQDSAALTAAAAVIDAQSRYIRRTLPFMPGYAFGVLVGVSVDQNMYDAARAAAHAARTGVQS